MALSDTTGTEACPFIDDGDARCDSHFSLTHVSRAFRVCVDGYRQCPTYWRLARQHPQRLIVITANGRALQPTGS